MNDTAVKPVSQEGMKERSLYLKGVIAEDLASDKPAVLEETYELLKFHGTYEGYNRDTATERKKAGLEKEYEFMVRLRIPGGRLTAEQYLKMDEVADKYANGTLRITTRETIQFHVIQKHDLKPTIAAINHALLSTLSACGDVVRNIATCPAPIKDKKHQRMMADTLAMVELCAPKTTAYREVWLDETPNNRESDTTEPLYGRYYLPRKFKIGLAAPDDNSIDVLTHDLAIVAIFEGQEIKGYNICLGGGLGMNHGQASTYPRLATPIAFIDDKSLLRGVEAVVKLQRDHGDRTNRKHARLKYLVEEKGVEWTRATLENYYGEKMQDPHPVLKYEVVDHIGWHEQGDGNWYLGVRVPAGRVVDYDKENVSGYTAMGDALYAKAQIRTGLRAIIEKYKVNLVFMMDQNIILCDITPDQKADIEAMLAAHHIPLHNKITQMQRNFLACVALPTCGKALAEAERIQFPVMSDIQTLMDKYALKNERIAVKISGCPNGCSRPYTGDIGIVGRMPGHYVIFVGGDFEGARLNTQLFDKVPQADIPKALDPIFEKYSSERQPQEGFGDFCNRYGIEQLKADIKPALGSFKWAA